MLSLLITPQSKLVGRITFIPLIRKLRPREVEYVAQHHTASEPRAGVEFRPLCLPVLHHPTLPSPLIPLLSYSFHFLLLQKFHSEHSVFTHRIEQGPFTLEKQRHGT